MASLEAPKRITELDAVNIMLANIGEDPVSSLGPNSKPTAQKATSRLAEESIRLQSLGKNFSTLRELELEPNSSGHILLPDNLLSFHPVNASQHLSLVEVDGRLENSEDGTSVFTETVYLEAVLAKPFRHLAQPVRWFITLKATLSFANSENPGGSYLQVTSAELEEAQRAFEAYDRRLRKGGLRAHNPHFRRLRGNR